MQQDVKEESPVENVDNSLLHFELPPLPTGPTATAARSNSIIKVQVVDFS
jgi:hypothetical protein